MKNLMFFVFVLFFTSISTIYSQTATPVQCGAIVEDEFTADLQPKLYSIELSAGDRISTSVAPLGTTLEVATALYAPNDAVVWLGGYDDLGNDYWPSANPQMDTDVLSANGTYIIAAYNGTIYEDRGIEDGGLSEYGKSGGVGVYTLFIGCTLRDGTGIEPGDSVESATVTEQTDSTDGVSITLEQTQPVKPEFSGFGFPGLAPVDFTNGVTIPLTLDVANAGSISTGFEGIFGFSFTAEASQSMSLDFVRTAGNLNLGVVLLSADNQVAFQASLVTSNTLSTEMVIPASGDYTLGVFRIELIPPDAPENTTFTLSASLN